MKNIFSRKNLFYFLYLFVFTLIVLEIFGRIYLTHFLKKSVNPKFRFNSFRIYEHVPGFHEGDGKRDWIVINNEGFRREKDVAKTKPANTYRIFLMGASAAHGISTAAPYPLVHIYMDETIDAYLEKKLKALHPDKNIEVINAAVTGYQCFQHTAYLLSELLDYHPECVIFFDGANDHYFNNPDYDYYKGNKYQFWTPRLQHPSFGGWMSYGMLWLSKCSGFARGYVAWKLNSDASHNEKIFPVNTNATSAEEIISTHKTTAEKNFLRAIETNINILKANNIKCVISLQPMLVLRNETNLSAPEKSFLHKDEICKTLYPVVVNELSELTTKYNVPFIDFNPQFNSEKYSGKQLLIDYCHLSPMGGEAVADGFLSAVDSLIKN